MITTLITILVLPLVICLGLYIKAAPIFEQHSFLELVFSSKWEPSRGSFGFWPFIAGSLYVTLLSFLFTAPVCLLAALYLTQFAPRAQIGRAHV